jgi:hypothetical protein
MSAINGNAQGASCSPQFRYAPGALRNSPLTEAHTAYVIGGLYGNVFALREILRMQRMEAALGRPVTLVFNGDHNWFDIDAASFEEINTTVLKHTVICGNVECSIATPEDMGCGCDYPDYVNPQVVDWSNEIMTQLRRTASNFPDIVRQLGELPMSRILNVGDQRIGIVHGDAESLSGWSFAAECLSPVAASCSGDTPPGHLTPERDIATFFRGADVLAFASSHTCLPHARDFSVDGSQRLIINNGAAGMANFAGTTHGVITRISVDQTVPPDSLYGATISGVRFDALPVHFDASAWIDHFASVWPTGTPAHRSYFDRIRRGPNYTLAQAVSGNLSLASAKAPQAGHSAVEANAEALTPMDA